MSRPYASEDEQPLLAATDGVVQARPPSLGLMQLTVFFSSIGFTVVLPTLYFYLEDVAAGQHLSAASQQQFLGLVVGMYSVGQFLGSLVFGFWGNRRRTIEPLLVSLIILMVANIYYSLAEDFPRSGFPPQWHLFISRFFVGFGAGNVATCRAFISEATTIENRNTAMTITGAAQGLGFVLGPALGFALAFIPTNPGIKIGPFTLDGYTSAGFVSALITLINLLLLPFLFVDVPSKLVQGQARVKAPPMTRSEAASMFLVMWIFFVILTGFSIFETITGPMTQFFFGWTDKLNGLLILGAGLLSVFTFGGLGLLNKKFQFDDRKLVVYGLVGMFLSNLACIPYWGSAGLHVYQIMLGAVFVALGYPVASAIAYALFSKVIAPVAQGTKMGYLTAGGSLARILGPVWATAIFDLSKIPSPTPLSNHTAHNNAPLPFIDTRLLVDSNNSTQSYSWGIVGYPGAWMFMAMAFINLITIFMMLIWWKRLVPHPDYNPPASLPRKEDHHQGAGIN